MNPTIKEAEITELEVQNRKRNVATFTSFLIGGIAGYFVYTNFGGKKGKLFQYIIGGSLVLGTGYWLSTLKGVTKRKNAIQEKKSMIERGNTKPAPAPSPSETQPTTVVELTNNPTKPSS